MTDLFREMNNALTQQRIDQDFYNLETSDFLQNHYNELEKLVSQNLTYSDLFTESVLKRALLVQEKAEQLNALDKPAPGHLIKVTGKEEYYKTKKGTLCNTYGNWELNQKAAYCRSGGSVHIH